MIVNNSAQQSIQHHIYSAQQQLEHTSERLATGKRINQSRDDAAGHNISRYLDNRVTSYDAVIRSVDDARSVTQLADGGVSDLIDIVQRLRELAIQATSDLYSDSQRTSMDDEATQLMTEMASQTRLTSHNGHPLLDGSFNSNFVSGVRGELNNLTIAGLSPVDVKLQADTTQSLTATLEAFENIAGQSIQFEIEGVAVNFTAAGSDDQAGNATALLAALDDNRTALASVGIEYTLNTAGTGVELTLTPTSNNVQLNLTQFTITQDLSSYSDSELLAMEQTGEIATRTITNGNFEAGLDGWSINTNHPGLTGDTPSGTPIQQVSIDTSSTSEGTNALKMEINGQVTTPYGTAHGPEVTSAPC